MRTCAYGRCGASLEDRTSRALYCDAACRAAAHRERWAERNLRSVPTCKGCGEPILDRRKDAKWCTERCRVDTWRRRARDAQTLYPNAGWTASCNCAQPMVVEDQDSDLLCHLCGHYISVGAAA